MEKKKISPTLEKDREAAIAAVRLHSEQSAAAGTRPLAFVLTFGCQQNEADSEKIRGLADAMGYGRATEAGEADLILVNTCAVREHAELKALSIIGGYKHIKQNNPSLIIGVCGCMAARPERVEQIKHRYPYVDFTLEPAAIGKIPSILAAIYEKKHRYFLLGEDEDALEGLPITRTTAHRAWVSIMYGCNNFCSYCIVPHVRGRERSRAALSIVREVEELVSRGVKDITLLGQNVNSYCGDDGQGGKLDFAALLSRLDAIEGDYILRFMTSHPKDVPDALIDVLAKGKHIEPHFHLPLQSGSDRILKRMNRHYDLAHYLQVVEKLRRAVPGIAISSDIIVGFPGETEEDFALTLSVLEKVRFDSVYSFIYSPRSGTPAATYPDQIPPEQQSERFGRLLDLQSGISGEVNTPLVGQTLRVLVDSLSKSGDEDIYSGRTDSGKLVHIKATEADIGLFKQVKIDRATPFALYGTIIA